MRAHHARRTESSIATFEMLYLTGWAPHESQQQPLKPGSAKTRLAEALGTVEHTAKRCIKAAPKRSTRNMAA